MLGLKSGVPCKLLRLDATDRKDGYEWDGVQIRYPSGGTVPWMAVMTSDWEVVKGPTVEEYVRERGFRLYSPNVIDVDHAGGEQFIRVSPKKPFTLETAKIACDALEALK